MSQTVARNGGRPAAAAAKLPVLSEGLASKVNFMAEPRGDLVLAPPRWTLAQAEEARAALPAYEAQCEPAARIVIDGWLLQLMDARLPNPPGERGYPDFLSMALRVCGGMPRAVWCEETLLLAVKAFKFYPSVHDLNDLLSPIGRRVTAKRDALRRAAAATRKETGPIGPRCTPEEAAQVMRSHNPRSIADEPAPTSPRLPKTSHRPGGGAVSPSALAARFAADKPARQVPFKAVDFGGESSPKAMRPAVRANHLSGDALATARASNPTIQATRSAEAAKSHGD